MAEQPGAGAQELRQLPRQLALPTGLDPVDASVRDSGNRRTVTAAYRSSGPPQEILPTIERRLKDNGWTIDETADTGTVAASGYGWSTKVSAADDTILVEATRPEP